MKEREAMYYAAQLKKLGIATVIADTFRNEKRDVWGLRTRGAYTLYTSVPELPLYWQQLLKGPVSQEPVPIK